MKVVSSLALIAFAGVFANVSRSHALSKQTSSKKQAAAKQDDSQDQKADQKSDGAHEEPVDDDPAAVNLDVSKDPPLIRELYLATRETKEKDVLAHTDVAKKLIADGADVGSSN
jgi:hypothetical protein